MTSDDIRYEQQDQANEKYITLLSEILYKLQAGTLRVVEVDSKVLDDDCENIGYYLTLGLDVV